MTAQEIKDAVRQGKQVFWSNPAYEVKLHKYYGTEEEQWLITCSLNNYSWGLTWADDVTLNGKEDQFYVV